ncbi:hypothetical protein GGE65_001755 [Skermanella aerolata]|uniref:NACHT domain-containing protein n=1 Tax=Skermanella aerolata TaxID=393310 RepID=UPI003D2434BA
MLSAALDALARPNLQRLVPIKLARDLKADRDIRREARQNNQQNIALHDVFVDLPIEDLPIHDSNDLSNSKLGEEFLIVDGEISVQKLHKKREDSVDLQESLNAVARLLQRSADKLDPEAITLSRNGTRNSEGPLPNRIVILGGPGQGKSTIGQFLAQVLRSRALTPPEGVPAAREAVDLAEHVLNRCKAENLPLKGPIRYPLRIELPAFADAIDELIGKRRNVEASSQTGEVRRSLTLLAYASRLLSRDADKEVEPDDLRAWLGRHPWLVILDGLDEVPPSGSRKEVISEIKAFWDDVHSSGGDVLVVVTSRQQGYGFDLDKQYWEHWTLAPLTSDQAMHFADRQATVLLADPDRKQAILAKLNKASKDSTTAPLMISPLQVAMLYALAEVYDDIPSDRWTLFNRYYEVLRDREAAKPGSPAKLIRQHKVIIDDIHRTAGFLLHVRAEMAGGADAYLTLSEFGKVVHACLSAEYELGAEIVELKAELIRITTDRLVLLNCRVGERVAFDVRSLQEFTAAWCLMYGPESTIMARLRSVAARSHWRHVVRIAVSKIFGAEPRHLRQDCIILCHHLDNPDACGADSLVKAGAWLALDLIHDNVAKGHSQFRRQLLEISFKTLDLGVHLFDKRLAHLIDADTVDLYRNAIAKRLSQNDVLSAPAALKLALNLLVLKEGWVESTILENLPRDSGRQLTLFQEADEPWNTNVLRNLVTEAQINAGFSVYTNTLRYLNQIGEGEAKQKLNLPVPIPVDRFGNDFRDISLGSRHNNFDSISIMINKIPQLRLSIDVELDKSLWALLIANTMFSQEPNRIGLASAARFLALYWDGSYKGISSFSWPMQIMIREATNAEDMLSFALKAEAGDFGDHSDWIAAEKRWEKGGIGVEDFVAWTSGYLHRSVAVVGAPPPYNLLYKMPGGDNDSFDNKIVEMLLTAFQQMGINTARWQVLKLALAVASRMGSLSTNLELNLIKLSISSIDDFLHEDPYFLYEFLASISPEMWNREEVLEAADRLGQHQSDFIFSDDVKNLSAVVQALCNSPDKRGLLHFIVPRRENVSQSRTYQISLKELIKQLPPELLLAKSEDSARIRHDIALLRLASGEWQREKINDIMNDIMQSSQNNYIHEVIEVALTWQVDRRDDVIAFLSCYYHKTFIENSKKCYIIIAALRRLLDSIQSDLCSTEMLRDLELPSFFDNQDPILLALH